MYCLVGVNTLTHHGNYCSNSHILFLKNNVVKEHVIYVSSVITLLRCLSGMAFQSLALRVDRPVI